MESETCGLLLLLLLHVSSLHSVYITQHTDHLHQVLSEFSIFRPIRTDAEGRYLSSSGSTHQLRRDKRHTSSTCHGQAPPTWRRSYMSTEEEGAELFYNVTAFGEELHLRLKLNSRLVAPTATMEWEESGRPHSQPIREAGCYYTGRVSNMEGSSVAISNCDGLAGMIRTSQDEFFIEPLNQRRAPGAGGGEEGGGAGGGGEREGQPHIIYRSSAIIMKRTSFNQTTEDFIRGPLLGSLDLDYILQFSSSRRRRYAEEAELFNIEVLLAVDYTVLLFHGRDHLQNYLLTLMNIVNEIYQDYSLGINMNVVLARIIILSPSKSQELVVVGDPQKSLEKVCRWSYFQQREESDEQQHDHTIYLTRQEFGPSGMQGYAPVTGMCQLHRSCALVFEDGFMSAFVAAHETGHV